MNKYVKSEKLYTPQTYCEKLTGCCYGFDHEDTVFEMETVLKRHGLESEHWSYPLSEIDHIVENNLCVGLVDVSGFSKETRSCSMSSKAGMNCLIILSSILRTKDPCLCLQRNTIPVLKTS